CEFASMMADLGTQVTILEVLPKILLGCDKDVADVVARSFKKRGIDVHTGVPGVYAVGDVIAIPGGPHPQLAHVGYAEGVFVIRDILGEDPVPVDYSRVPWCIYCHPEVAFAGFSEEAAKEAGYDVVVKKMPYAHNGRAQIIGEGEGLVKVI